MLAKGNIKFFYNIDHRFIFDRQHGSYLKRKILHHTHSKRKTNITFFLPILSEIENLYILGTHKDKNKVYSKP